MLPKKMKEMGEKMKEKMAKEQEEQQSEDYATLRQILENLVELATARKA